MTASDGRKPPRAADLSAAERDLLVKRLRAKKEGATAEGAAARPDGIARRADPALPALLSDAERRLWFLDRLDAEGAAYNIAGVLSFTAAGTSNDSALDPAALAGCLAALVARHEALRSAFPPALALADGEPRRLAGAVPAARSLLPVVDLSTLPAGARGAEPHRIAVAFGRQRFDLARGPIARFALLLVGERAADLVLAIHHVAADGGSVGVLAGEISALYPAAVGGRPSPLPVLPTLPIGLADLALWQRERAAAGAFEADLAFWRDELAAVPPLELPADRPRPALQGFRGVRASLALDPERVERLAAVARGLGATPFMLWLAAFAALLERQSGQVDFALGTPIANRERPELAPLVGCLVNTLALRVRPPRGASFESLLAHVRDVALAAYGHREVPFERVVETLDPVRDAGRTPLFQALFTLRDAPPAFRLPGLDLALAEVDTGSAKFDLALALEPGVAGGFRGHLEIDADLFERTTGERLARRFEALAAAAAARPEAPLFELDLLAADERRQIAAGQGADVDRNGALPPFAPVWPTTLEAPFFARAAARPDDVALLDGATGEATSYGELAALAGDLASRLVALGVGPEVRVGLATGRGREMVAGMLGILRAGGAYVPLDPAYPADRLAYLLEDSGAHLVVASDEGRAALPAGSFDIVPWRESEETALRPPCPSRALPGALAYLIYTSGSTGRPKGVGIEHASAVELLAWAGQAFSPAELSGMLAATSMCFDLSVFEIFATLAHGGTLVLAENALALGRLHEAARARLTFVNTVPSALAEVLRTGALPPAVGTLCLAGEPLPEGLVAHALATGTVRRVINAYGPSEDTTYSTFGDAGGEVAAGGRVTIGKPLPNTRAHLLEPYAATPTPVWCARPAATGELWLGSASLARGYLGRPDATADAFRPDPFSGAPGARIYRTGDLARLLPDGRLEFLGRRDHQVKVRGFRVELGEVEAALAAEPGVQEAAVAVERAGKDALADADAARGDRLVGYLVLGPAAAGLEAIRAALARRLPAHMVPTAWVELDALPRTPNGKLDRKALPRPDAAATTRRERTPPATPTERRLAALWQEVLGLEAEALGVEDDLFALGAHSLLAAQIGNRIERDFGLDLSVRELFRTPVLGALAARIDELRGGESTANAIAESPPIPRRAAGDPGTESSVLSFAQERLWFLDQLEAGADPSAGALYNLPALVRLRGERAGRPEFAAVLARGLARVVARHEVLRTVFEATPDGPRVVVQMAVDPMAVDPMAVDPMPPTARAPLAPVVLRAVDPMAVDGMPPTALAPLAPDDPRVVDQMPPTALAPLAPDDPRVVVQMAPTAWAPRAPVLSRLPRLPIVDLRALASAAVAARDLLARAARRPFDLARGPLLRAALVRLAAEEAWLFLALHHIAADGWSIGILARELLAAVDPAAPAAKAAAAPEIQYADFAAWQRAELSGERRAAEVAWWRAELAGLPPVLELPADRPRPAVRSPRGDARPVAIPEGALVAVDALARRAGASRFMVLLAAWDLWLGRHADRGDVAVATPVANRPRLEVEALIGCFVNTLVLRVDLEGAATFADLVARVRDRALAAYAHEELPFELLVDALAPERSLAHAPLAQVMFALQPAAPRLAIPGLEATVEDLFTGTAKFDLSVSLFDAGERRSRITGFVEWSRDLFDQATVDRFVARYLVLVGAAVETPERPLDALPWLTPAEERQVASDWDAVAPAARTALGLDGPLGRATLPRLVLDQAAATPAAIAVTWVDPETGQRVDWTYRELAQRAGRIARELIRRGLAAEDRVGVLLRRTPDAIAALLGTLMAGGAYVPLDPAYPESRLGFMLDDSGARCLLSERAVVDRVAGFAGEILLREAWGEFDEEAVVAPPRGGGEPDRVPGSRTESIRLDPDHLAYLIYTSGSTGRPKGVAISHRSAVALVAWARQAFSPAELTGVVAATSLCFDLSVYELFLPLATGGRIILVDNALALATLDPATEPTLVNTVPSALAEALDLLGSRGEPALPETLRTVNLAGEALPGALVDRLYALPGVRSVWNLYGPSEDTTYSTAELVPRRRPGEPTIGRPLPGTWAYVLDRRGALVPPGVAGELLLGGSGLARGYLGRPELTAERFVPDPFAARRSEPSVGARLYRTGDLARRRLDGTIEYLGRIDHQVKIRGFRVELGEVEAALLAHPAVRAAAVIARRDRGDLVGWIACAEDDRATLAAELKAALAERLPAPLVPAVFGLLDALPTLPNGKVDRGALARRAVEASGDSEPPPAAPPETSTERALAAIWAAVLGGAEASVSIDDDFFAAGGHSLLAARVATRASRAFDLGLGVKELFARPTVRALAARIDELRGGRGASAPRRPPLAPRAERGDRRPLSFAEERLFFLAQLEPGSAAYNIPVALRLDGELVAAALVAALQAVGERHGTLRTSFVATDDGPEARIAARVDLRMPVVDLGRLSADAADAERERVGGALAREPFDLAVAPLGRAARVVLPADGAQVVLLVLHHLIADGWSLDVLIAELGELYGAAIERRPAALPALAVEVADYAVWQRALLTGAPLEELLAWWRERLDGASPILALPLDRPRPVAAAERRGATVDAALPVDLATAAARFAAARGATPFSVLLAGFFALLARWSGARDLLVGLPVAGRHELALEPLIGLFVNTVVARADLAGDPPFEAAHAAVARAAIEAQEHADLPFERLVEELRPERQLSASPIFQVLFQQGEGRWRAVELPGVRMTPLPLETGTSKFDLSLTVAPGADGAGLTLRYDAGLFDGSTMARLLDHFVRLLSSGVAEPSLRLSELPMLGSGERAQLLAEWQGGAVAYDEGATLWTAFCAAAAARPDGLAVRGAWPDDGGEASLTFGTLAARAAALGARLRELGVGPEVAVPFLLERTPRAIEAVFGILAAGGAFVPLDPGAPPARLAEVLADCDAPVVVTERSLAGRVAGVRRAVVMEELAVGSLRSAEGPFPRGGGGLEPGEGQDGGRLAAPSRSLPALPDSLCYVLYTSGSTGKPKGAMIRHRGAVHLAASLRASAYGGAAGPLRIGVNAPLAFDGSIKQVVQIVHGDQLELVPDGVRRDPEALVTFLAERDLDGFDATPSQVKFLLGEGLGERAHPGRVLVGGEEIDPALWSALGGLPRTAAWNVYGPTECTVDATARRIAPRRGLRPSLGLPIPNVSVHLLDADGALAPIGVIGELSIGGAGVSRGYLGRPDLTADRFVPDPFGSDDGARSGSDGSGARLYRTGDLGRRWPDGSLEILGRADRQVKVRGVRIELGEIEAVLSEHPRVGSVAVLVWGEGSERRLVGYVAPRPGLAVTGLAAPDLRIFLAERLPEALIPSTFVVLDALPLSPNGKVDRKRLPAPPDEVSAAAGAVSALALSPTAEVLAGIWAELLGREGRLSSADDFFALGGHSLLAAQVASRVRRTFEVELPLRALFERPTLGGLAAEVDGLRAARAGAPALSPLVALPRDGSAELPLSFAQERLWFLEQLEPDVAAYNMTAAADLVGALDLPALSRALATVVARHEGLRTRIVAERGVPRLAIDPPAAEGDLAAGGGLAVVDLGGLSAALAVPLLDDVARRAAARSFDLARGPLVRALVVRALPPPAGTARFRLVVAVHHIAADGWSVGVFLRDLAAAYAPGRERAHELPALPVQVADVAAWQRGWLRDDALAREVDHWRRALAGAPDDLGLATDRPRPERLTGGVVRRAFSVDPPRAAALERRARRLGATPAMVWLAAWDAWLARVSGTLDVAVGTPVAGRTRIELEELIGFFVNTLVLRVGLSDDPSLATLVARVRAAQLDAHAHQDLPFELLVEALAPERRLGANPLFQPFFNFQEEASPLRLAGVAVLPLEAPAGAPKFDLALSIARRGAGFEAILDVRAALFDPATAARMADELERMAVALAERPEQRISEVELLGPARRQQVLVEWNDMAWPVPSGTEEMAAGLLHERFERQAASTSERVAVIGPDGAETSYGALDAAAARLADRLRARGVGPEVRVGVCLQRSTDLVVALLAVLKAGGAYVPLDPAYPESRLRFMLEDSDARLVLAESSVLGRIAGFAGEVLLREEWAAVDPMESSGAGPADPGKTAAATADNLAYLIYTSGSTGRPKGVAIAHRSAVERIAWAGRAFDAEELSGLFAATSVCFDLSVFELFGPLSWGGRVILAESVLTLGDHPARGAVRLVNTVPSAMGEIVRGGFLPEGVTTVCLAGEALPGRLAREIEELGIRRLSNLYGPSEDTTYSTEWRVDPGEVNPAIGRPLPGSRAFVLGRFGEPVPMGAVGEIALGGCGLARGYLGRPDLTAERFVPDGISGEPGARLYRTGDLGRARGSGALDYLGRVDQQVKVRGYRIELGEIETVLAGHPAVREVAVAAGPQGTLVAFIALVGPGALEDRPPDGAAEPPVDLVRELVERCRAALPAYMVPGACVPLPALPKTPNGKIDRRALGEAAQARRGGGSAGPFRPPATPTERGLAAIWVELLGRERIGLDDGFFELGGHSLLAVRAAVRIREAFGVDLPLRELFRARSLEQLAGRIDDELLAGADDDLLAALLDEVEQEG